MRAGIRTFYSKDLKKNIMTQEDFYRATDPTNIIITGIQHGITHYEITCDMNWMLFDSLDKITIKKLFDLKEKYDLSYSVHLPFRSIELAFPDEKVSDAYCSLVSDYAIKLKILDPEAYVLHPTANTIQKFVKLPKGSVIMDRILDITKNAIEKVITKSGVKAELFALENLKFPFYELKEIIVQTGVSVCMDAGHIISEKADSLDISGFLDEFYERIIEIHLHDGYNRNTELGRKSSAHLALGQGDIDYIALMEELKAREYDGIIILETEFEDALQSYEKIKQML